MRGLPARSAVFRLAGAPRKNARFPGFTPIFRCSGFIM